jgi:hypothetical protein
MKNNGTPIVYSSFSYSLNTTYLLVTKHQIVAGASNDVVTLFVNPVLGAAEPAPTVTAGDNLTVGDPANLGAVAMRQGSASSGPFLVLDGIRVGLTWSDVTGLLAAPTVTTGSATSLIATGATLNGTVNPNSASSTVTFNYGTTTGYGSNATATQSPVNGGSAQAVSAAISGLTRNTLYHYRVSATNSQGTTNGPDSTFTTRPTTPTATAASSITQTSFTANWTDPDVIGGLTYTLDVATDAGFTSMVAGYPQSGIATTSFSVTGLANSTTYFYRVRAIVGSNVSLNSNTISPTTLCVSPPSVNSDIVTIGAEPATLSSIVNNAGPLTSATGAQAWKFRVRDGGASGSDTDHVPTKLFSVTLTQDSANQVSDWSTTLLAADLFLDSTTIPHLSAGVISANSIAFSGFAVTAPDGGTKDLILRVSLKNPLPAGSDNLHFGFKIVSANVTGGQVCTTSQFGAFSTRSDNNLNKINVVATKYIYATQPPSTAVARNSISTALNATDANSNIDLDYVSSVTLARGAGTGGFYTPLGGSTLTHSMVAGATSWSDLRYNKAETGVTVVASGSVTSATSTAITFTTFTNSQSDVVTNAGEAATISSLVNNASPLTNTQGVQAWDIKIRDGGVASPDSDALPTLLTALTLTQDTSNTVPNWSTALLAADLFLDSTNTAHLSSGVIGATGITFSGFTAGAKDDSVKSLILRLSLRNPLPAGSDGQKFGFAVLPTNVTAAGGAISSLFNSAASTARSNNTKNIIDVAATKLAFTANIPGVLSGQVFTTVVNADDANNNIDKDYVTGVALAKASGSGTLTVTTPRTPVAGVATFNDAKIVGSGNHSLIASSGILSSATSNTFIVGSPATFKVSNAPAHLFSVDTLAWDSVSTWTVVRGASLTGIPHMRDSVLLDHDFRATAYTIRLGPTISDSCRQITIGYPGNTVPIGLWIPPNNNPPGGSANAALWFGDSTTGNYDFVLAGGGTVYDNKIIFTANVKFATLNDSMKIRTGGLWYHNTSAFNTMHRILSRAIDGDYGTIQFDVDSRNGSFDASGGGNYYYPNIQFSNSTGFAPTYFWFGSGATTIHGNVTVDATAKDSLMLNGYPFLIHGNYVNNGTTIATTSQFVFDGTGAGRTVSGNPLTLNGGLLSLNPNGATFLSDVNVGGGTVQTTGNFTYDSSGAPKNITRPVAGTISMGATKTMFLNPAGATMNEGSNPVQGNVSATRTVLLNTNETFGAMGYEINAAGSAPGVTTILRKTGAGSVSTGNGHQSIKRYFDVTPTNNIALNATVGFTYSPSELNNIVEGSLLLHKSTNAGSTWTGQSGPVNTGIHKITAPGVGSFSRWTAASVDSPMFITHTITIRKYADGDGNFGTAGDETLKKWRFALYKDSVSAADSIAGGNPNGGVLTVNNLAAGTYIAVEGDSTSFGWTRLGKVHHGVRVASTARYDTIVVSGGVGDSVDFINGLGAPTDNSITIRKFKDSDGNFNTTGDRTAKVWYLELRDTSGTLIGFTTDTALTVGSLAANEYVVKEADSTGWIHLGSVVNGVPIAGSGNSVLISVSGGQNGTVDLVNAPPSYSQMYRSFQQDSIALDKDNKGKVGKFVKRKADKADFVALVVDDTATVTGLHVEFGNAILLNYPFFTTPPSTHASPDGKNKKWDFTFTSPVHHGDTVLINGFGDKGKIQKVGKYFWENGTTIVGTKKKNPLFTRNDPKNPMPNRVNALFETFAQTGFGASGLQIGRDRSADSAKQYGWILAPKYTDAQKSLKDKTGLHTGFARGFDTFTSNGKPILKGQKSIPPAKQNNMLIADMIALKLNIAASTLLKTPLGFGELIYGDTSANPYNGLMVKEIAAKADTLMMGRYQSTVHVFVDTSVFRVLDQTIKKINSAFEGAVDTIDFAVKLHLKGTKRLADVPYLHANPSVVPALVIPLDKPIVETPQEYKLYQNYPNPFNPTTTIQFDLMDQSIVTLKIYNILGQEVATLLDHATLDDGTQEVEFNASNFASGVYFYRLISESVADPEDGIGSTQFMTVKKMLLIK